MSRIFIPGIYCHYSGGRYVALAVASDKDNTNTTKREFVVYRALDGEHAGQWFVRSKDEFLGTATLEAGPELTVVTRFVLETPFEPTNYKEPTESTS